MGKQSAAFFVTALAYAVMHSEGLPKWWPNYEVHTILQHQHLLFLLIVAITGSVSQNNCITLCIYYSSWCEKQVAMLTWQVCTRKETSSTGWWSLIQIQRSMASLRWYVLLVGFHQSQKVCECISNKCTEVWVSFLNSFESVHHLGPRSKLSSDSVMLNITLLLW